MCRSIPWIQKRLGCRGLSKWLATQEDEPATSKDNKIVETGRMEEGSEKVKENKDWQEQLDTQSDQQRHKQNLILRQLQRTMDPLVAARAYNSMYTIFGRMPDEILLKILHCIGVDPLTLHCLRRVSTTFRRIIFSPDIVVCTYISLTGNYFTEDYLDFPYSLREQLWRRLQRDEMCGDCRRYRISTASDVLEAPADSSVVGQGRSGYCKFSPPLRLGLRSEAFCTSCRHRRPLREFSAADQRRYTKNRQCIGCQGSVKLCEHVNIRWATIKDHIASWQQQQPKQLGTWQDCYSSFKVECRHPSHDRRCHARVTPTWPRARLRSACDGTDRVVLELRWEPHSGSIFGSPPDGRVPASEMKALLRSYRRGAAGTFFPAYPSNPLPEMACFGPSDCGCLRYEGDDSQRPSGKYSSEPTDFFKKGLDRCAAPHRLSRLSGYGTQGEQVSMRKHWPRYNDGAACLITTYQRRILVCRKSDLVITPTHSWLHAMDPGTYASPDADPAFPVCRNEACINYCRRPRAICCTWNDEYYDEN